jgi:NOL1/NOP2/fmu family ribosome biogenesis protein
MRIQILDKTKKKKFIEGAKNLGLKKIPELLIRAGKEKIRAYSGNLSKEEIMVLWRILPVEGIGVYVGKENIDRSGVRNVRLSIEGLHVWKDQITYDRITLTKEQETKWFLGQDIELTQEQIKSFGDKKNFIAIESFDKKDFIGTAKIGNQGKTLFGFLPKERRRKNYLL